MSAQTRGRPRGLPGQTERDRISRVLIVEDNEGQRFTLAGIMEQQGFGVITCGSAAEAVEHVQRADFGVVVVDLRLPDLEGTQLLERIRERNRAIRVIIHTAYGSFDSARDSINKGAFAYVEKADDPAVLVHQVQRAFREQMDHYASDLESAVAKRTSALRETNAVLKETNAALRQEIADRRRAETHRAHLESELRHAQKMEAVGTLAAGVAHDFNNILTVIMGYADVASLTLPDQSESINALEGIVRATRQAGEITQSLLTLSRKGLTQKTPVKLGELVADSMRMLRGALPESIEFTTEISPDDAWVEADATQLQQVVVNLVVNARDAMPDGGRLRVSVHPRRTDSSDLQAVASTQDRGRATLAVEDSGIGMPQEVRSRLFEPFFTTKPREQGTGLGMAIVHGIITKHNGKIEVDSREGHGTRIAVTLPCCEPPVPSEAPSVSDSANGGHNETILVVDDQSQVRSILAARLCSSGYHVLQASDGVEALEVFEAHRKQVRVVVIDLDLPKMSGLTCLRKMRKRQPGLLAVIVTGHATKDIEEQLDERTRLLPKPFRVGEFETVVHEVLAGANQQTAPL